MIARLVRWMIAAQLAVALAGGVWLFRALEWPAWAAALAAIAVPVILHGWATGWQSIFGAWQRHRSPPLPAGVASAVAVRARCAALRAWLGETWASMRTFGVLVPWSGEQPLPSGNDPARIPVLLVHGYFCNRAVWRPMAVWLAARGHPVGALNMEPPFADIDDYAPAIDAAIEQLRARTGAARVAIIGHSMGGIALRAWMRRGGTEQVAQAITLGSPHHGTWSAKFGRGHNVAQMTEGNPWLAALAESETPALRRLLTVVLSLHDNIVMPQTLQTLAGAQTIALAGLGHLELAQHPSVRAHLVMALDRASEGER